MVLAELSCDSTVNVRMASSTKFYCVVFVCLKHSTLSRGGGILLQYTKNEIAIIKC